MERAFEAPYTFDGRPWYKVENTTAQMSWAMLRKVWLQDSCDTVASIDLESSFLFAVQKIITTFEEKGGKSEICVVQSISVGESSFFLLYIECYPIIHSLSIDDDILSTQDFFGTSMTLDSVTDGTVIQCVPVGFVNGPRSLRIFQSCLLL